MNRTPVSPSSVRVSCDSLVALGAKTLSGRTIFAKNSDRPAAECQPLAEAAAATWPVGAKLRCQYVEIDQAPATYAFVGARPAWLWGLEHGVNEKGVAIGNHTIFTRDPPADTGLLGMDLVRLGLERAATAAAAVDVIIELIERHGQGGSGYEDTSWPYNNSFLVADAREAFLLEASSSRWALKRCTDGGLSASNHASIGTDWDRLGHDTIEHAVAHDWWPEPTGVRFDFARAYRSTDVAPPVISSGRYGTTCAALADGRIDVARVRRVLRDHYDGGEVHVPGASPDDERYFSVCMHADPVGTTTASMVVELHGDASRPVVAWMALASPCVSTYLPTFVGTPLPPALTDAGPTGAWRRFKALLSEVEQDFVRRGPFVREFWKELEARTVADADAVLGNLPAEPAARAQAQKELVDRSWARASEALATITEKVRAL